jgi:hypothetical protein
LAAIEAPRRIIGVHKTNKFKIINITLNENPS